MRYELLYDEFKKIMPECVDFCALKERESSVEVIDGVHIIFRRAVVPYILQEVEKNNEKSIKKIFEFLENMAKSQSIMIREVLGFTILEAFADEGHEKLKILKKYMLDETLKNCIEVEKYFY